MNPTAQPPLKNELIQIGVPQAQPAQGPARPESGPQLRPPVVLDLKVGEAVRVRSVSEILATLDAEGKLESVPFMPEMLPYCGRQFRVSRRADRTCAAGEPRSLGSTVHLDELRCSGSAHHDCQAQCLLLWKEAWLERAVFPQDGSKETAESPAKRRTLFSALSWLGSLAERPGGKLMCQATELRVASCPLSVGGPVIFGGSVVRALLTRKIGFAELRILYRWISGSLIRKYFFLRLRLGLKPAAQDQEPGKLDLQPGELVEPRSIPEILSTLNAQGAHRGLQFKPEMFAFCGGQYRVRGKIETRVNEQTGDLAHMKNECVLLDSVYCGGQLHFCSRSNYFYWREEWLRRVSDKPKENG